MLQWEAELPMVVVVATAETPETEKVEILETAGDQIPVHEGRLGHVPAAGKVEIFESLNKKIMATKTEEKSTTQTEDKSNNKKNTLLGIFEEQLKDIYSAEKQLVAALPEVAKATDSEDLEEAINEHLQQTKKHVDRLEKVFERMGISKTEETKCQAMEGLIAESKKVIREFDRSPVRDSALIIGAQKIEHYEIAAYGSLCELADVMGEGKIADLLDRTLEEEENTDKILTEIAQEVNDSAAETSMR